MADVDKKTVGLGVIAVGVVAGAIGIGAHLSNPEPRNPFNEALYPKYVEDPWVEVDRMDSVGNHHAVHVRRSTLPDAGPPPSGPPPHLRWTTHKKDASQ